MARHYGFNVHNLQIRASNLASNSTVALSKNHESHYFDQTSLGFSACPALGARLDVAAVTVITFAVTCLREPGQDLFNLRLNPGKSFIEAFLRKHCLLKHCASLLELAKRFQPATKRLKF